MKVRRMGQDTDVARVVTVLRTPGIRYRSFGNQPVREPSGHSQPDSPAFLPTGAASDGGSFPATGNVTIAAVAGVENLLIKQPAMETSPPATPSGDALLNKSAFPVALPPVMAEQQPPGMSQQRPEVPLPLAAMLREAASPPPEPVALAPETVVPPLPPAMPFPLGGAASLLAALHAAETQHAAVAQPRPAMPLPNLPVAMPVPPPLLSMLGSVQPPTVPATPAMTPAAPPPLLAALSAPPQAVVAPIVSAPATASPAALGDILRSLGQPPAPPAPAQPEESAVPEVLRALRLKGLG